MFNAKNHAFTPTFGQILKILHAVRICPNLAVTKCELQDDITKYAEKMTLNTLQKWFEPLLKKSYAYEGVIVYKIRGLS